MKKTLPQILLTLAVQEKYRDDRAGVPRKVQSFPDVEGGVQLAKKTVSHSDQVSEEIIVGKVAWVCYRVQLAEDRLGKITEAKGGEISA